MSSAVFNELPNAANSPYAYRHQIAKLCKRRNFKKQYARHLAALARVYKEDSERRDRMLHAFLFFLLKMIYCRRIFRLGLCWLSVADDCHRLHALTLSLLSFFSFFAIDASADCRVATSVITPNPENRTNERRDYIVALAAHSDSPLAADFSHHAAADNAATGDMLFGVTHY